MRIWRRVALVACAVVLLAVAWFAFEARSRQQERERRWAEARQAWQQFARCLVGEDLGPERPSQRLRRIELGFLVASPQSAWPDSCRPALDLTLAALERLELPPVEADASELRRWLEIEKGISENESEMSGMAGLSTASSAYVRQALQNGHSYLSSSNDKIPVDEMFAAARHLDLDQEGAAPSVLFAPSPAAPPPASPLLDKMPKSLLSRNFWVRTDATPGDEIRLIHGGRSDEKMEGGFACIYDPRSADPKVIHCRKADREGWSSTARPLSSEKPGAPLWIFDSDERLMVRDLTHGTRSVASFSDHSYVLGNGDVTSVTRDSWLRRTPEGEVEQKPIEAPPGSEWIGQSADLVLWSKGTKAGQELWSQSVSPADSLGQLSKIGELPFSVRMFGACRRGPWQVVALKRFDKQPGVVLLFRDAGRFLPPVTSDLDPWSKQLACRPGAVSFTWFHDGGVSQLTCTPKGCGREDSKPLGLRGKVDKLAIADLDGTVVLASVRSTTTPLMSVTRALLLRTGSVSEIALAPERVVIGDEHHDGVGQLYSGLGLVQGAGVGVLLFHHGDDIAMLRVDRTGKVTPLTPVPLAAQ